MNAYTVSRLAFDAGVSVHIVRDYLLRGLLRPVACTTGGYGLFDDAALQRLCFVRAAFEAGIPIPFLNEPDEDLAALLWIAGRMPTSKMREIAKCLRKETSHRTDFLALR